MKLFGKRLFFAGAIVFFMACCMSVVISYRVMRYMTDPIVYPKYMTKLIEKNSETLKSVYGAQEVSFITDDGIKIAGLLILRKNAKRNFLICHGYRRSKEYTLPFVKMFDEDNLLLIDFRGHGQSGGDLISVGYREKNDIRAAVKFLQKHFITKNIPNCGLGVSMGAASLITAAADGVPFEALISDSSFAFFWEQMSRQFAKRTGLPTFPFFYVAMYFFELVAGFATSSHNPADYICNINCPILIVHSKVDTITPVEHAQLLYDSAIDYKQFWLVMDSFHGKIYKEHFQEYAKRVDQFLNVAV